MDTIYSLFQKVVKEHENAPLSLKTNRAMTFGELSNMVDMITCSFPQEYTASASSCVTEPR